MSEENIEMASYEREAIGGDSWGQIEYPEHAERKEKRVAGACVADKVLSAFMQSKLLDDLPDGDEIPHETIKPFIEGLVSKEDFKACVKEALVDFVGGREIVAHPDFADWVEVAVNKHLSSEAIMPEEYDLGTSVDLKPMVWRYKDTKEEFATAFMVTSMDVRLDDLLDKDEVLYAHLTLRLLQPLKDKWQYEVSRVMRAKFPSRQGRRSFKKGKVEKNATSEFDFRGERKEHRSFYNDEE